MDAVVFDAGANFLWPMFAAVAAEHYTELADFKSHGPLWLRHWSIESIHHKPLNGSFKNVYIYCVLILNAAASAEHDNELPNFKNLG